MDSLTTFKVHLIGHAGVYMSVCITEKYHFFSKKSSIYG